MRAHDLAERLGYTVADLLDSMDAVEFRRWAEWDEIRRPTPFLSHLCFLFWLLLRAWGCKYTFEQVLPPRQVRPPTKPRRRMTGAEVFAAMAPFRTKPIKAAS